MENKINAFVTLYYGIMLKKCSFLRFTSMNILIVWAFMSPWDDNVHFYVQCTSWSCEHLWVHEMTNTEHLISNKATSAAFTKDNLHDAWKSRLCGRYTLYGRRKVNQEDRKQVNTVHIIEASGKYPKNKTKQKQKWKQKTNNLFFPWRFIRTLDDFPSCVVSCSDDNSVFDWGLSFAKVWNVS